MALLSEAEHSVPKALEIHLAEEIVDPDANQPLASDDEDAVVAPEATATDSIMLADTRGEVTFLTMQTSSLRATDAQATFAGQVASHNREAQAWAGSSEPAAPETTAASGDATPYEKNAIGWFVQEFF